MKILPWPAGHSRRRTRIATPHASGSDGPTTAPLSGEGETHLMDWRHRAACLDEDPELFFPIGNTGPALLQIEEAKGVCRRCDVLDTCLRWALESGQDAGVWGGLSEDERRALKRRNARARRAS
jgi:WhiB family redox-sensing transcriptional regulator